MNLRKLAGLAVLAFAVFYAISNPIDTAGAIRNLASAIGAFASALASGGH